ncbi:MULTISPECIES: acyl-CoA dehydrogenase family protein [unclassified Wenzhouxiangella]|uniref:acyl-CoA dehydrogenase family protein n=1 Tax=unclassified Wenzhouxiangella TaxID=2613841 RepID=UPI000E32991F|nr:MULTISPECIES: acyl-CoA dehydrogenase family protein [unclassified Wenzhouxiangella]RFF26386.1 DNA alkylation response protein [Wenzhouxiangella sp. 15181]RFP67342.1 DNA alkylation response protein [Wenzhouxiangella sp. 15190]
MSQLDTHEVFNQPQALTDYDPYEAHPALQESLVREGGGAFEREVRDFGRLAASEIGPLGFDANEYTPRLRTHDRFGHRIDRVDYHPAYHRIMEIGLGHGLASLTWSDKPGGRIARSAMMFLHNQFEAGTMCPITMTHAVVPALRAQPEIAAEWEPRVLASTYDSRFRPPEQKRGVTLGMAMTEKQGGSDVRANTTRATPLGSGGPGAEYDLVGHKWFCSAPMCDAFLTLAQTDEGLSCFLVPRFRPDGSVNPFHIMRLKDKLGNRSNASSEIEYPGTWARMVGEPGRGVATIIRMVAETRLDCVIGSASLIHKAVVEASHYCRGREAFGATLIDQPLMSNVLADLSIESEASMTLAMFLAGQFERASGGDEQAELLARIATPVAKYWVCKRAVGAINEAQECLGGAGYVEESILPRLYREAPVNAIWEGSGNVQCLDVLRAATRDPRSIEALVDRLEAQHGAHEGLASRLDEVKQILHRPDEAVPRARKLTEDLVLCLQATVLIEADSPLAEAFCEARLTPRGAGLYGDLPQATDSTAIVERTFPA